MIFHESIPVPGAFFLNKMLVNSSALLIRGGGEVFHFFVLDGQWVLLLV